MSSNKIISLEAKKAKIQKEELSLQAVKEALDAFRANKIKKTDKIPLEIWVNVGALSKTYSKIEIIKTLHITNIQLENAKKLVDTMDNTNDSAFAQDNEEIPFCKVQEQEKTAYPLDYKSAEAFTTRTSIVELYRPDGMLMKIHICTDRFEELLSAFFKGAK